MCHVARRNPFGVWVCLPPPGWSARCLLLHRVQALGRCSLSMPRAQFLYPRRCDQVLHQQHAAVMRCAVGELLPVSAVLCITSAARRMPGTLRTPCAPRPLLPASRHSYTAAHQHTDAEASAAEVCLHFLPDDVVTTARSGDSILAAAHAAGVDIATSCCTGSCGICEARAASARVAHVA